MFLHNRLSSWIAGVRRQIALPLRIELWNGQRLLDIGCGWGALLLLLRAATCTRRVRRRRKRSSARRVRLEAVGEDLAQLDHLGRDDEGAIAL